MVGKLACACASGLITLGAGQSQAATLANDSAEANAAIVTEAVEAEPQQGAQSEGDHWHFAVTPYLWASGVSGDVQLAEGEEVEVDSKFTDILANLKFAAMLAGEARKKRFVVIGDVLYLSLGVKGDGPRASPLLRAKVDSATFIGTLLLGYRVVDKGPLFVDLLAGGRLTALNVDVELSGPQQTIERDRSKSSLAPVLGARFRVPLGDRWGLAAYGDIGGFGATSDMSWQLMGTVQYDLSNSWRISAGYRHVAISHEKGDFDIDMAISGPILGLSYRF